MSEASSYPPPVKIRYDIQPGDIGSVIFLHGTLYAVEQGWDYTFEAYVAAPLGEFAKSPGARERLWIVENDGQVAGSIAIVAASPNEAQLRWFLLHPDLRGLGLGKRLINDALEFCKANQYASVFLWTVSQLPAAAHLYQAAGFQITEAHESRLWGATVTEQRYDLSL